MGGSLGGGAEDWKEGRPKKCRMGERRKEREALTNTVTDTNTEL